MSDCPNCAINKITIDGLRLRLDAMTTRAETAEEKYHHLAVKQPDIDVVVDRLRKAEAKLKVADAMLSEIWGAYNRIGDALKMPEKQAAERGEA